MYRFFETIPGILAWTTIILMFVLSWLAPVAVAIFVILFDVYWLFKTIYLSFHLRATFSKMRQAMKINWLDKLTMNDGRWTMNWKDVYHLIILPMYKEPYEVVRESFEALAKINYQKDKLIVVLATEERAGETAQETAKKIQKEFGDKFFRFLITIHPANIPGELPGKGSNQTWAAKEAKRLIIDPLIDGTRINVDGDADKRGLLYENLTYKIREAIFKVYNSLGPGHKENVYRKSIEREFQKLGLNFEKEKGIDVIYDDDNNNVGIYRPDFIVEDKIILEIKALPCLSKLERKQIWSYLKSSDYKLALLTNFGREKIEIKRIVYETARNNISVNPRSNPRQSALSYENILVSIFDADTQVLPEYFGILTYNFLTCPHPQNSSFQPIPLFTNNIFQAPALARVISFSSSFWHMMQQSRPERQTTFSSHSMPFKAVAEIGFWNTNIVSEDSQIFWQCFLHYNGNWRVVPLFYPVSMDANVAPSFWQTMINQYKQQRRWGWGAENIPYFLNGFKKNKKIPSGKKWYWSFVVIESFHSWATNALIIFLLGWLPLVLGGPDFNLTLLSHNLPQITQIIMTLAMVGIVTSAILSIILLPPRPNWFKKRHYLLYFFQWLLMPITLIVFGAFPGLEAQTRLMLSGRFRLGFWFTPKHR